MRKLLAVFQLKLLLLRGNWNMLLMMTLSPILFTLVIGGMSSGSDLISVYIADQDQSAFSAQLLNSLDPKVYSVQKVSEQAIFDKVDNNEIQIGYIIPHGLGLAIERGAQGTILVVKQPNTSGAGEIPSLMNSLALRMLTSRETAKQIIFTTEMFQGPTAPAFQQQVKDAVATNVEQGWSNQQLTTRSVPVSTQEETFVYDQKAQSSMGFLIFFLMFTLTFGINEILDDKQLGTWSRVLSTPTRSWQLLGGHFLGTMFIGVIQVILLVSFGYFFMGVQWGRSPLGVSFILFALIFALTSLGLMLAGFVQSKRQLQALYPVLIVSTSMLGGCMWPLEIVPDFMKVVAQFIPQGQAMMGLTDLIVRGAGIGDVLIPILSLFGMGLIFFTLGAILVRREM